MKVLVSYKSRLIDVIENLEFIMDHRESYGKNKIGKYAIERAIMIVGESMRVLNTKYDVDWENHKPLIQMGDYIDHNYASIDYSIIVNTIDYELPSLLTLVKKLFTMA